VRKSTGWGRERDSDVFELKAARFLVLVSVFAFAPLAQAQQAGVIDDPDGFVNVRAGRVRTPP
jgi:hypothetical protein